MNFADSFQQLTINTIGFEEAAPAIPSLGLPDHAAMPRILAIDWDRHEVRGLLLSSGPTGTAITGAWAAPLHRSEHSALTGKQIGERLSAAMANRIEGKVTTLVAVGRDNVQIQLLTLPPAPADELSELVRFQAEREFTALGVDAALDYIPIVGDAQTPHQVLAVALNSAGLAEARDVCDALGLKPGHIQLRAIALAALVRRLPTESVVLMVNQLTDEADLTVQADGTVVLMRTVRLPDAEQAEARQRALLGEIRRTMAAIRQQLANRTVEQVIICGNPASLDRGPEWIDELNVPVQIVDPVSRAPAGLGSQGVSAESLSRFAAVLGMALSEADRQPPVVDFANVRRRTEARRFSRVHALTAAAAAVAALWFAVSMWRQIVDPTRELAEIESRIRELQEQADMYKDVTTQAAAIDRWLATDVNWLDELEQFARRVRPAPLSAKDFPADNDVVVTQLTMLRPPGTDAEGGRMDLQAKAKNDAAVRDLEQRLRTEQYRVVPGGVQEDNTVPGYPRALDLQIYVAPPSGDETPPASEAAP